MQPAESTDERRGTSSIGGVVAAIGGAVVVVAAFLELLSVTVGRGANQVTATKTYYDTDNGKVVAALGVVVVVLTLAMLLLRSTSIIVPVAIAACGLAALGLAVYDRIDLNDASNEAHASFGPALYVAMAGGLLATIGAVLASRDR